MLFVSAYLASLLTASSGSDTGSALEEFFIGATEGTGTVQMIASGRHAVRYRCQGRKDASGALVLDQTVHEDGKPVRRSLWRLVQAGNGVTGTVTNVQGQVAGKITGNVLHLRYRMKDGPSVKQWITLQPGGRTAKNRITYHRFGLKIATVETNIRKIEAAP